MRKIFKKVVTAVASLAMMAGLVAMSSFEAFAGAPVGTDGKKTIYVVVDEQTDSENGAKPVSGYALNFWTGGLAGITKDVEVPGWSGGKAYSLTKVQDNLYKLNVTVYDDLNFGGIQVLALRETDNVQYQTEVTDTQAADIKTSFLDANSTEVWIKATAGYKVEKTTPVAITASDADIAGAVVAKIDAALALEAKEANKTAYDSAKSAYDGLTEAQKALVPAEKVKKLDKGIADIQAAIDAANAAAAGKLTIYVKSEDGWTDMNIYGWDGADFGAWPGKATTACTKNAGWFSCSFDITKATNLIFNTTSVEGDAKQTVDINNVSAGTYWYTVKKSVDGGKCQFEVSTTAPAGWVDEAAAVIEQETPGSGTGSGTGSGNAQTTPKTGDATPVAAAVATVVLMGIAVVVLNTKKANR